MKEVFKKARGLSKKSDFVRWALTTFMLYKACLETGPYTGASLVFIFIALESLLIIERLKSERLKSERLKSERLKQLTTFLDNRDNIIKQGLK